MFRDVMGKVAWVGRTASMVFGLALVLALMFGVAGMVFAANGQPFILGQSNVATAFSRLTANVPGGSALQVVNNNAAAGSRALQLSVAEGRAPVTVNATAGTATNLDADQLDGQEASDLAEPRGYAHIADEGAVDPAYSSKGVNGVVKPEGETSVYCFDLTFTPKTAVGSPFLFNSAVVATVTPPNAALTSTCPPTHDDAAAQTYGSSTGTDAAINFQIVFE